MLIPFVSDALGNSVVYEEHKGDYALARRIAEDRLSEARRQGAPRELADALLARGVVHLLQGQPPAAVVCFGEVERIAPHDPARLLIAASYSYLATLLHYNAFPNGSGAMTLETQLRWDPQTYVGEHEPRWSALLAQVADPSTSFQAYFLYRLLGNLPPTRSFLDNADIARPEQRLWLLGAALQAFESFLQDAGMAEARRANPRLTAYICYVTADLYRRARQQPDAWGRLEQARTLYLQSGDAAGAAACAMAAGDWWCAPNSTPAVWNHHITEGSTSNALAWNREAAEFDFSSADAARARAAYGEAAELFGRAGAKRGLAALHLRYGYLGMLAGDYAEAARRVSQALDAFRAAGDELGAWTARAHAALCLVGLGQVPEDAATAEEIGAWGAGEGSFSFSLGLGLLFAREGRRWLTIEGDYERALACYRLGVALFRRLGATNNIAQCLVDIADTYAGVGEQRSALSAYEEAQETYAQLIGSQKPTALAAWQQAIVLGNSIYQIYVGRRDAAGIERSAARLQSLFTNPPQLAAGAAMDIVGQNFPDTLPGLVAAQVEQAAALAPLCRAIEATERGDEEEARRQSELALAAAQRVSGEERHFLEAGVLRQQKRYQEASEAYQRYVAEGSSGFVARLVDRMADIFGASGEAQVQRHRENRHELGAIFFASVKDYAGAERELQLLEREAGAQWWARDAKPWEPLSIYGDVHQGLGRFDQALIYYDRAIAALEERRGALRRDELKTALAGGRSSQYLYFMAARAALKLGAPDGASRALEYIERGKARGLLDLMTSSAARVGQRRPSSGAIYAWQHLNARLATWQGLLAQEREQPTPSEERLSYLRAQIAADESELRQVEADLAATDPYFYRTLSPQAQVLPLDQVRAALAPGVALLEYAFLGEDLLAWAITDRGIIQSHHAPVDASALKRKIYAFRDACAGEGAGPLEELGQELSSTLLAPLGETIKANRRLLISPYGPSHVLPFHALPWEGKPLGASHALSYLPSASTLQFLRPTGEALADGAILAVGNPARMAYAPPGGGEPERQRPLEAAAAEAIFVASLFPRHKLLTGPGATEDAVRAELPAHSLLHFATHGYLSEEAPLLSSILLADGEALTVYDLMGIRLDAELVTLSACRTALGEATGGDDVLGLTRGLLGAGARSAIVTLWPVNDVSTCLLMSEFYRRLRAGEPPALALQAAQTYLRTLPPDKIAGEWAQLKAGARTVAAEQGRVGERETQAQLEEAYATRDTRLPGGRAKPRDYTHPYYWAPFILVG